MSENPTIDLPERSFQQRVLAEFAALRGEVAAGRDEVVQVRGEIAEIRANVAEIRAQQSSMAKNIAALDRRLTSLEEKVDARLRETRPIWEAIQTQIKKLDSKFDIVIRDLYEVRGDVGGYEKRLTSLNVGWRHNCPITFDLKRRG
jgi:chromosome segregation ATPase